MPSAGKMLLNPVRKGGGVQGIFDPANNYGEIRQVREIDPDEVKIRIIDAKKPYWIEVTDDYVDGDIEETMEGATNFIMVLHDPDGEWSKSGHFHYMEKGKSRIRRAETKVDGIDFRLAAAGRSGDDLTLTFEDALVADMRRIRGPIKATRGKVTRAEFIFSIARRVKGRRIKFFSPELHKKQKVAGMTAEEREEIEERRSEGGRIPRGAKLTVKGKRATWEQIKNMNTVLRVCGEMSAPPQATVAVVVACIVESTFKNLAGGHSTSSGILQLLSSTAKNTDTPARDVEAVVREFLLNGYWKYRPKGAIELANRTHMNAAQIAQACQGSAYPGRYAEYLDEAKKIVDAWGGDFSSEALYQKYEFKIEGREDGWSGCQRIAEEVGWRLFMVRGWLYYISEEDLLSNWARTRISEEHEAIIGHINFDCDAGKAVHEASFQAAIAKWGVPPGTPLVVEDSGVGDGRWLVASVRRKPYAPIADITLRRANPDKPEPRPELRPEQEQEDFVSEGGEAIDAIWKRAKYIHSKHYPYVWGGGHARAGLGPSGGGYDCSGGVAAVLEAANLIPSSWRSGVPASGTMATSWGKPGRGKYLTLWANNGHVYLEVKIDGKWKHLGTGDWGKGWRGMGINTRLHPHGGYTARHWPGL